jgi:hypothetical protein
MSLVPACVVCDAPVANPYAPDALCERCKGPCPTCNGDVAHCQHPLPVERIEQKPLGDGWNRWAA